MNSEIKPYDIIVLGFDKTAEETVEAIQEQGKRALYIPIDPQTILTLMSQKQASILMDDTDNTLSHINVHYNKMETSLNQTTTYFIQPEMQQIEEESYAVVTDDDEVEDMPTPFYSGGLKERIVLGVAGSLEDYEEFRTEKSTNKVSSQIPEELLIRADLDIDKEEVEDLTETSEESIPELETTIENEKVEAEISEEQQEEPEADKAEDEKELEVVNKEDEQETEEQQELEDVILETIEKPLPIITPLAKECSLIDNRLLGIRESSYRDRLKNSESILSSYHLFNPIRIEEDQEEEKDLDSLTQIEPLSYEESISPHEELEAEVENSEFEFNLELNQSEEVEAIEIETYEPETIEATTIEAKPLILDHDIRLRKKLSFQNRHQNPKPTTEPLKVEQLKTTEPQQELEIEPEQENEQANLQEVFSLEPFSSRRRNKKSRLFSSLENPIPKQMDKVSAEADNSPSNMNFSDIIKDSLVTEKEDLIHDDETIVENESLDDENFKTSSDTLKIDTIEFEEPYGYSNFDDVFPSFSNGNNRKRQELDKIEKRKIALRGLHNLINNLG